MDRDLARLARSVRPPVISAALRHALSSGGKRLRALLVILGSDAVGGNGNRALPAAVAVECLHNFTLIHDDLMDRSTVRRGKPTVHAAWGDALAVLAGDHLLAAGYSVLLRSGRPRGAAGSAMTAAYSRAFLDVCEGQAYDLGYEGRRRVTMREYLSMIDLKTARVIAAAVEIGALAGGGSPRQVRALRSYGQRLGLAFQIMDDLLDVTGEWRTFGKKIGADIARGKKTYLLVKAMQTARGQDAVLLRRVAGGSGAGFTARVRSVYMKTGAVASARREIGRLTRAAKSALGSLPDSTGKTILLDIADRMAVRTS